MNLNRLVIIFLFYVPWICTLISPYLGFIIITFYIYIHYTYKNRILLWFENYSKNN